MTSHDITFCANSDQCRNKATCRRAHPPNDVPMLSFALFWKPDQGCAEYWPTISPTKGESP